MVTKAIRPAIFKWRYTEPELILCAVRWYLRYSLSFRDVEELLSERGLEVDHTTIWRWVQRYGPELEERLRRHLKTINRSWRVDETYVCVKGRWCYLYRALDSTGATIDFVLSGRRDAAAATRLCRKALTDPSHPQPRVINTDQARLYGSAIAGMKKEGILRRRCRHRPVQYVNNIVEQDHRAIKRRVKAKQGFREFQAARLWFQSPWGRNAMSAKSYVPAASDAAWSTAVFVEEHRGHKHVDDEGQHGSCSRPALRAPSRSRTSPPVGLW